MIGRLLVCVAVWIAMGTAAHAAPSIPPRGELLAPLHPEHPRLLARRADFDELRRRCQDDERAGRWLALLRARAEKLLALPVVTYRIPDGKRLLAVSREAKERMFLLGLMHRLSGERRYSERAWKELVAVAGFKDWNPSHFLDTAEMTCAVAIGYDWLFDAWNDEQRARLREAILRHGFQPALAVYRGGRGWSKAVHNWNQVCNGGLILGALAIGDSEPDAASEILDAALHSLPLAMREFAPDGGWGEGPGYWKYATEYNVLCLAALESALRTDFGLAGMPGFSHTGDFPLHFVGPTGKTFNFADAHEGWQGAPQWFWLATKFAEPAYAHAQLPWADAQPAPLDLLWGARWSAGKSPSSPPLLARLFRGVSVATLRSRWNDPDALFVGFKGGDNRVNHGHLDLGSFVLDAQGRRWAVDLGPDDYNLSGYFGGERWKYLRNGSYSHNTLILDGTQQAPAARAPIVRWSTNSAWSGAVADLSQAWPQAQKAQRGIALIEGRQVVVQDEVAAKRPVACRWQMLTAAQIDVAGTKATLTIQGRRMQAILLAPAEGRFEIEEVEVAPPQPPVQGIRKLVAAAPSSAAVQFAVVFQPDDSVLPAPKIVPLDQWPAESEKP